MMVTFTALSSVPSDHLVPFTDQLRLAVAAYLAWCASPLPLVDTTVAHAVAAVDRVLADSAPSR
jgi:hypothetical protein